MLRDYNRWRECRQSFRRLREYGIRSLIVRIRHHRVVDLQRSRRRARKPVQDGRRRKVHRCPELNGNQTAVLPAAIEIFGPSPGHIGWVEQRAVRREQYLEPRSTVAVDMKSEYREAVVQPAAVR